MASGKVKGHYMARLTQNIMKTFIFNYSISTAWFIQWNMKHKINTQNFYFVDWTFYLLQQLEKQKILACSILLFHWTDGQRVSPPSQIILFTNLEQLRISSGWLIGEVLLKRNPCALSSRQTSLLVFWLLYVRLDFL